MIGQMMEPVEFKEHEGRKGMPDDRKYGEDQVPCAGL